MTQVHKYRAEVGSNWKLFIDAFAEFYHAPVLHAKQAVDEESRKLQGYGYEALAYDIDGPHGMVSSWGGMSPPKDLNMVKPIERVLRSGLFGPWERARHRARRAAAGHQPVPPPGLGRGLVRLLPQLHAAGLEAELVPHVPLLADVLQHATSSRARCTSCRRRTPTSGCSRSWRRSRSRSTRLQDGNTLEATQTMLESRAVTEFPLNDQEILLRHLHKTARGLRRRLPAGPPRRRSGSRPRPERRDDDDQHAARRLRRPRAVRRLGARDRGRALRQAPRQLDGRAPGLLRRRVPPARSGHWRTSSRSTSTASPTTPAACCGCSPRW